MTFEEYQKELKSARAELKAEEKKLRNANHWGEPQYELRACCDELNGFIDELNENWEKQGREK